MELPGVKRFVTSLSTSGVKEAGSLWLRILKSDLKDELGGRKRRMTR